MKTKIHITLIVAGILSSCIAEYYPSQLMDAPDLLVVDGIITNGTSVFRLSTSVGLDAGIDATSSVDNAQIFVEDESGRLSPPGTLTDPGRYSIPNGNLHPDSSYRIRIVLGDEIIVSEFLRPLITPVIDSITYSKAGSGAPIKIQVSTHEPNNQSHYFRWSYFETYEFTAQLYANVAIIDGVIVIFDEQGEEGPANHMYYCWQRSASRNLILASSAQLSENVILNHTIQEIEPSNKKLSVLYHIAVTQHLIRKEAYDYFSNLQKNIESMGSIFAPIPSEMNGNLRSLTSNIPVIGYVDVSTSTTLERFIERNFSLYEQPRNNCEFSPVWQPGMSPLTFDGQMGIVNWVTAGCVDCTLMGGSKNKPDFWPNSHL